MSDPAIPYGHKQVYGQLQKGDGIWDEAKQRFVKVKKCYPTIGLVRLIAIRKMEVVQPPLPGTEEANVPTEPQPGEARGMVATVAPAVSTEEEWG